MTASGPDASLPTGIATFSLAPYVFDPAETDAVIAQHCFATCAALLVQKVGTSEAIGTS